MAHRAATDEICVTGVWGTPHQAKGGDSSESPPAVFWLQKTLLATFATFVENSMLPFVYGFYSPKSESGEQKYVVAFWE